MIKGNSVSLTTFKAWNNASLFGHEVTKDEKGVEKETKVWCHVCRKCYATKDVPVAEEINAQGESTGFCFRHGARHYLCFETCGK